MKDNMKDLMSMIGEATNEKIKCTSSEIYNIIRIIVIFFSLIIFILIIIAILFFYESQNKQHKQIINQEKIIVQKIIYKNNLRQNVYLFKTKCIKNRTFKYYRKNDGVVFEYYTVSVIGC